MAELLGVTSAQQTVGDPDSLEQSGRTKDVAGQPIGDEAHQNDLPQRPLTSETVLYVATNLNSWETDQSHHVTQDVNLDGTVHRRLDPSYYAWLRNRVTRAKKAAYSGHLDRATFDGLRGRFNDIHVWAIAHFGEDDLPAAIRRLNPKTYPPPTSAQYLFPKEGDWRCTRPIPPSAMAKVDAIRDRARSLGWSEPRLYQNRGQIRFPCGHDYGPVCFVDEKRHLGELTRQYLEIIDPPPRESRPRFYNPDVDQPWLRRVTHNRVQSAPTH